MKLELCSGSKAIAHLEENEAVLGSYCKDGMRIHVTDNILIDLNAEKFELTLQKRRGIGAKR